MNRSGRVLLRGASFGDRLIPLSREDSAEWITYRNPDDQRTMYFRRSTEQVGDMVIYHYEEEAVHHAAMERAAASHPERAIGLWGRIRALFASKRS